MIITVITALLLQGAVPLEPTDTASVLVGVVVTASGVPVAGANVFLVGTLNGASTDSLGRFRLRTAHRGRATITARKVGFNPASRDLTLPEGDTLRLVLQAAALSLETVRVEAGRHAAGTEQGATLTALEVSSIPGARGDIARALQTLPGVQSVDEGTGLFVRGGDSPETKVFLNGAELLDAQRLETPVGSAAQTVDPFLLEGIAFSTGAFSARFGNALSAVAELASAGRPRVRRSTLHASLASVSARFAQPLGASVGAHATLGVSDNRLVIGLNGSPRRYERPPYGHAASGSVNMRYRPDGEVKVFGIHRANAFRVWSDGSRYSGTSELRERSSAVTMTWSDRIGPAAVDGGASFQRFRRVERFGALNLDLLRESPQGFLTAESPLTSFLRVRGGADIDAGTSALWGSVPKQADDVAPGRPVRLIDATVDGTRIGAFGEGELSAWNRLRLRAGLRMDRSVVSGRRTWDPRAAAIYVIGGSTVAVLSAGGFHQAPDPVAAALGDDDVALTPMASRQVTAGISTGADTRQLRIELYARRFNDLVQLDRDRRLVSGGSGRAHGADVFLRGTLGSATEGRAVYSLVRADRTDPASGQLARAPFDVTHSALLVAERTVVERLTVGAGYRLSTGRPYTPVVAARGDSSGWTPTFGTPFGARLPTFHRLDLSTSWLQPMAGGLLVGYASLYNLLGRTNVAAYRYSSDYRTVIPIRSHVGRSVFFGASYTR